MPVYFAQAGEAGPVKIGYARDPLKRVALLQTASAEPMQLIRVIAGRRADEAAAHLRFAAQHIRGEWFAFVPEMLTYGQSSAEIDPVVPRRRVQFHPIVEELIQAGEYSRQAVSQWRARGVPYPVCLKALVISMERGNQFDPDLAIFRRPRRPRRRPDARDAA